jgi:hypothetical protein
MSVETSAARAAVPRASENAVDSVAVERELTVAPLQLRRVESELAGSSTIEPLAGDAPDLYAQVTAQRQSHRQQFLDEAAQERAAAERTRNELAAGRSRERSSTPTCPSSRQPKRTKT